MNEAARSDRSQIRKSGGKIRREEQESSRKSLAKVELYFLPADRLLTLGSSIRYSFDLTALFCNNCLYEQYCV